MRLPISIVFTLALAASLSAQLPPLVQMDLYLLKARKAIEQEDYGEARKTLERLRSLETTHDQTPPEAFYFRYAQMARLAGFNARAVQYATRYLEMAGRKGGHYSDALELLNAAQAGMFSTDRTCGGKPKGSACWMELSSHPSCYLYLQAGATASWSGECRDGLAQGEGTLTWSFDGSSGKSTGLHMDGKRYGPWTERYTEGSVMEGPYVYGKQHGPWTVRYADGVVAEDPYVNDKFHGQWTTYSKDGTVLTQIRYKQGKPE